MSKSNHGPVDEHYVHDMVMDELIKESDEIGRKFPIIKDNPCLEVDWKPYERPSLHDDL